MVLVVEDRVFQGIETKLALVMSLHCATRYPREPIQLPSDLNLQGLLGGYIDNTLSQYPYTYHSPEYTCARSE